MGRGVTMSAQELQDFQSKLDLLSFADKVYLIEYLAKSLRRGARGDGFSGDEQARNGLDEAIAEFERGDYETFHSFEEVKAAMNEDG